MTESNYRKTIIGSIAAGLVAGAGLFGAGFKAGRVGQVSRTELEARIAKVAFESTNECNAMLDSLPGFEVYSVWPGSATTADYVKAYENMLKMRCSDIGQ